MKNGASVFRILIIAATVIMVILLARSIVIYSIGRLAEENEKLYIGEVALPNGYFVKKISVGNCVIGDSEEKAKTVYIEGNVTNVAWDNRYVAYERDVTGNSIERGLIDTQSDRWIVVSGPFESKMRELGISSDMSMKPVYDLFPETKKE